MTIQLALTRSQHSQECKDPRQHCFRNTSPRPFDPKINGFLGLIVEHLYVKLHGVVEISSGKTDRHTGGETVS